MYTSGLAKRRSEPLSLSEICFQAAAIIGVLAVPTIGALFIDSRELNDVSVWDKPLKFEASLILHLITLGLLASLFTPEAASRLTIRLAYQVTAAAALGEIFYIVFQAARGRASHFNSSTVFEGTMYGIMGLGAVLLVLCSFIAGLKLLRGSRKETGPGLRLGAASGL